MYVLDTVSIAVKRHHDQGNSYKEQHLIGAGLQVQRFSPSSWHETWQHPGRHGSEGKQKTGFQAARRRFSKPTPTVTHFLQQGHIYPDKVIIPNSALGQAYSNHHSA